MDRQTWRGARIKIVTLLSVVLAGVVAVPAAGAGPSTASVPCRGPHGGTNGLIAAIQQASTRGAGTIQLAPTCTYSVSKVLFDNGAGPTGLPLISGRITINGRGARIVRATGSPEFRLFQVNSAASLSVTGLTVRGGNIEHASGELGGAILLGGQSALNLRGSKLAANAAGNGGAIYGSEAKITIVDSVMRGNRAIVVDGVGGAVLSFGGSLTIEHTTIDGNQSSGGGGGVSGQSAGGHFGVVQISDSTVSDNTAIENGGAGIQAFGPERLIVRRSTIASNKFLGTGFAGAGGGIFNQGRMTLVNTTLTGNVAGERTFKNDEGGAIFNGSGATGTITNSTIAGNASLGEDASGGGIAGGSGLTVTGSIVANNRGGNCHGPVGDGGFDLELGTSCGFTKHAVRARPGLVALSDNGGPTATMALIGTSPAINRVPASAASCRGAVDQRGVRRPQGPRCDIGAFEVVATRTSLRLRALRHHRVTLTATVKPRVAIPGPPGGMIVFRSGRKILARRRLSGMRVDTASVTVRIKGHRGRRLTASYAGSSLFLPSVSATR